MNKPTYEDLEKEVLLLRELVNGDLTPERKELYRKINKIDMDFHFLLNMFYEAIVLHKDGRILYANNKYYEMFGYTPEELSGEDALALTIDKTSIKKAKNKIIDGNIENYEVIGLRKGGERFEVEVRPNSVEYMGKNVRVTILMDLSEEKKKERSLKESEERFRRVVESNMFGMAIWETKGAVVSANDKFLEIVGYSREDLREGKLSWEKITTTEYYDLILKKIKEVKEKGFCTSFEKEYTRKDGSKIPVLVGGITGTGGQIISYSINLNKKRSGDVKLKRSEAKSRALLNAIPDLMLIMTREGLILDFKADNSGQFDKNLNDKNIKDILPDDIADKIIKCVCDALESNKVEHLEYDLDLSGCGKRYYEGSINRFSNNEVIAILRDITDRKKFEVQLQHSEKMDAIGTLAGGIAHDFNNILGVITGNISYLFNKFDHENEIHSILKDMMEGTIQAQSLTQQLLTFSKGGTPVKTVCAVDKIVTEASKFVTRGSKTLCHYDIQENLWRSEVDEGQLHQVICNLVINSIQAMPKGGDINIRIENLAAFKKEFLKKGDYIKISITDHGTGINENDHQKIFEPYYSTKKKGSGLGLATAYSIVEKHHGKIEVISKKNYGATFIIYLKATDKEIPLILKKSVQDVNMKKGKVLIMDDEEILLKMLERILVRIGYEPYFAMDGREAVEMYKESIEDGDPFDLVMMDLTVPGGMGGKEAITELLKIDPKVKSVVSSGYSNDPVMANYSDYGFSGVIPKPYSFEEIFNVFGEIINKN
ncbi:MAG: PAS domain S-box protein [Desulfobacterales bacterium]|nr:PAS domain S-box protein [Desulfobacterales bacterium]MCP4163531.1 PAS domain S-box protein [Deltaproteobacteria bacterium]